MLKDISYLRSSVCATPGKCRNQHDAERLRGPGSRLSPLAGSSSVTPSCVFGRRIEGGDRLRVGTSPPR
jgi:hypothetical protein